MAVIHTKAGAATIPQISSMGTIDVSTEDFAKSDGTPFLIKNEGDEAVSLEVQLYKGGLVTTSFAPGWNPELVVLVKVNATLIGLSWGQ